MMEDSLKHATIFPTNVFLLSALDGYLLVDTSYEHKLKSLKNCLAKLGARFDDIRYIVLTHHHNDHVGNLAQLRNEYKFKIIAHRITAKRLAKGELGQPLVPLNLISSILLTALKKTGGQNLSFPPVSLDDDDVLFGDDGLDLRSITGVNARIIHTPGHSDDSVSIVLPDNSAIVGDLCFNLLPFGGGKYYPLLFDAMDKVYTSWEKLLKMGVTEIIPSHGKPFDSQLLARLIEKRNRHTKGS